MTVKLSSLRVTAEMDVSDYVRAAAEKTAADKRIVASSRDVGQALAAQDALAQKLGVGVASLSRSYIDGYAGASKFEQAVRSIGRALDQGMDPARAAIALDGVYRKFGQMADAATLSKQGFVSLAPVVSGLNSQYDAMAAAQERAAKASANLTLAQTTQASLNKRFGIGQGTLSARESASVFQADEAARMATMAGLQAQQIAGQFTEDLNSRLITGIKKSARDSASVFEEEFSRLDEIARLRTQERAAAFQTDLSASMGIGRQPKSAASSGAVFQEQFAQQDAMERSANALRQQLLPLQVEEARNKTNRDEIDKLERARVITMAEAVEMRRAEGLRTEQTRKSIEGMYIAQGKYTSGVGLARNEVVNLSRQLQDVAVTLQAGQPLSTILLQQGTQIADIFASSRANFSGFAAQAAGWAKTFFTSATGIVGVLAAVGVAAAYAGLKYADAQREVERSLAGVGRASGVSVAQINAISEAVARQKNISIASAREIASVYAGTGRINGAGVAGLSGITKDFAAQTGQDLTAAAQELAKAFADPAKGAEELNQKLGFLDAKTRSYIGSLLDQNNRTGAQKALLDALSPSIQGAAERVSWLAKAWEAVKNGASDAINAVGKAVAGQLTLEERLTNAVQARLKIESSWTSRTPQSKAAIAALNAEISELQERIRRDGASRGSIAADASASRESLRIQDIAKGTEAWAEELKKAKAELKAIEDALADINITSKLGNVDQVQRAAEMYRNAIASTLSPEQRLRREGELIVQSVMARTLAERQAAEIAREQLSMSGQKLTNAERELQIANRLLQVNAEAAREARDANKQANDNLATAGMLPYQAAMLRAQQEVRDLRMRTQADVGGVQDRSFASYARGGVPAAGVDGSFRSKVEALIEAVGDSGARMTSGFRTREKQQELYDLYGPGKAARPGSSQHEHGTAMDYAFSSQAARQKALDMASQYGLRALPSNGGAVHFDMGAGGGAGRNTAQINSNTKAMNDNTAAAKMNAVEREMINAPLVKAKMELQNQNELLGLQERNWQKSTYEVSRAAKEQELLNSFFQQGVPLTSFLRQQVADLASAYGRTAERAASVRFTQDVMFERSQIGRTSEEASIASRLRGSGIGMDSAIADQMRFNQTLEMTKSLSADAMKGFISDLRSGKSATEALTNALNKVADKLIDMAVNQIVSQAFGGLTGTGSSGSGGILGSLFGSFFGGGTASGLTGTGGLYAKGGVFANDNVVPFRKGGAMMYGPTPFRFGRGGAMRGLGGEAGPEAVMPLKRDSLGRLGVVAAGGQAGGAAPAQVSMPVTIINNQPVQVSTREGKGGGLEIVIDGIENRFADRASRNRGALSGMVAAGPGRG